MILSGSAVHVKGFGWRWSGDGFGLHELDGAGRYERNEARQDTRAGSYDRTLQTSAGEVNLKVPKLRRQTFETAIIERYRRRETSVEEALIEMYLAGISVRRVGGHHRSPLGHAGEPEHGVEPQQEDLRQNRGVAESAHRRRASVSSRRHRNEAGLQQRNGPIHGSAG